MDSELRSIFSTELSLYPTHTHFVDELETDREILFVRRDTAFVAIQSKHRKYY
jgi:hypothetical protein